MSLLVHLPLNGNLENKGLANVTVTNSGATVDNNGKIGQCYSFNSTYIKATGASIPKTNWTLATWAYITTDSNNTHQWLVAINNSTASDFKGVLCWSNNKFGVRTGGTTYYSVSSTSVLNNWYHVAATYKGATLKLYVNGQEVGSWNSPTAPADSSDIYLGMRGGGAGYFQGKLNDIRIYDHCLSPKEVKEISKGLIAHYKLDDITDNIIYDCSGYGHDGTITGNLTLSTDSPRYEKNDILDADNYITVDNTFLKLNQPFTIACFANFTNTANQFTINVSDSTNQKRFNFGLNSGVKNQTLIFTHPNNYIGVQDGDGITGWGHYVMLYNGTTLDLYRNGELFCAQNRNQSYTVSEVTDSLIKLLNRPMSDVRIYCTALSADDIKELYNTTAFITNNGTVESYEFTEVDDEKSIGKNGVFKIGALYESGTEYCEEVYWTGTGVSNSHPGNIANATTGGYAVYYADIVPGKKYVIELDFSWGGEWTFDETKTIRCTFQGSNNGKWAGTNYLCSALNSKQSLLSLVKNTTEGGSYHFKTTFSIPQSHLDTYTNSSIGTRTDYQSGTGYFSYNNLKIYKADSDLGDEQTKMGDDYITANNFIEI